MMLLSEAERDRLLVFLAAELARARRRRGLRLNVPEATALIADAVCEAARDGAAPGGRDRGGPCGARPGRTCCRGWPTPSPRSRWRRSSTTAPGWPWCATRSARRCSATVPGRSCRRRVVGRVRCVVEVTNTAAVPIAVTSHFHFFEANPRLRFDRAAAYGMHLADPRGRGGAVRARRHPPGRAGPHRRAPGRDRVRRPGRRPARRARARASAALEKARACGYLGADARAATPTPAATGRPPGDRIRLGDTGLVIRVEDDAQQRGDEFLRRVRQDGARRHAPARGHRVGDLRRRDHQRRRLLDPVTRHPQGLDRHPGGPHLRDRPGRQPRHAGRASTSWSAPAPRSSPARACIATPGAVDTHVHLLSPRDHGGGAGVRRDHDDRPGVRPGVGRRR